jgi:ATP-dependent RNA helicase RhlE
VTFASLSLAAPILDALKADGYQFPTPIQARAIPPALAKRDVLGIAQTGTGKTAAFALPILNRLLSEIPRGTKLPIGRKPKALVLAPTRELAAQIAESFSSYGRHTPLRFAVIFGGVGQGPQVRAIQQGIDILVATPGRLIDLLDQRLVSLAEIEFFVLDEADRMLDMGFIEPIRRISKLLPSARQTMLFSATMPKEIRHLADSLLREPETVSVTPVSSAVDRIDQKLYFVLKAQKTQLLIHLFDTLEMERTVVFTKTKHGADRLARKLKAAGIHAEAIHGDKAQNQRIRALEAFRSGRSPVLVATDVAARGLDIDDITHVVNYDLPMEPEAYVHRIGRTARAGKSGHAIAFCDVEEKGLLKQVERLIKFEIPRERVPTQVPKSDEAAAKAGLAPKSKDNEHEDRDEPMIETRPIGMHSSPAPRPRMNASGRPIPQAREQPRERGDGQQRPQSRQHHAPSPRSHGPRVDRRMDEGPRDAPREQTREARREPTREAPREQTRERSQQAPHGKPLRPAKSSHPFAKQKPHSHDTPKKGTPRMQSNGPSSGSNQGSPSHGKPAHAKPSHAKPAHGKPVHGGPGRFGQNPFGGGKPSRGTNFKGGTGFKGPRPSR